MSKRSADTALVDTPRRRGRPAKMPRTSSLPNNKMREIVKGFRSISELIRNIHGNAGTGFMDRIAQGASQNEYLRLKTFYETIRDDIYNLRCDVILNFDCLLNVFNDGTNISRFKNHVCALLADIKTTIKLVKDGISDEESKVPQGTGQRGLILVAFAFVQRPDHFRNGAYHQGFADTGRIRKF